MDELNQWENFAKEFTSDFEYVHMRNEMNSNRYEISFRLKISLRCWVSYSLVFRWIEAKWKSNGMDLISVILTEMKFHFGW